MRAPAKGRKFAKGVGISLRLTPEELARLQKVASDQDRTLSSVCRRLILRGLPDEERLGKQ